MSRRLKCLLVACNMPPLLGGAAVVYDHLARGCAGDLFVLTGWRDYRMGAEIPGWKEHDLNSPYSVARIGAVRPRLHAKTSSPIVKAWRRVGDVVVMVSLGYAVMREIFRNGIDLVCLGDDDAVGWLIPLCRWVFRRPVLVYSHGDDLSGAGWGEGRRRFFLTQANKIIGISTFAVSTLAQRYGLRRDKLELLPNGVDCEFFRPAKGRGALRARLGIPDDSILIMTVARLVERKGVDAVVAALALLIPRYPDIHYCVVGDGPERNRLQALVRTQGIETHVTFAGDVPYREVPDYLNLAKLFVMVNRRLPNGEDEGSPLVFLEASACGLPVVAGRAGGVSEVVKDGVTGVIVDGEDVQAIAKGIESFLADEERRTRFGEAGRKFAEISDWKRTAKRFRQIWCETMVK